MSEAITMMEPVDMLLAYAQEAEGKGKIAHVHEARGNRSSVRDIRMAAAIAKAAYDTGGMPDCPEAMLFKGILRDPYPSVYKSKVASAVFAVLARHDKLANPLAGAISRIKGIAGGVASGASSLARMGLGLSAGIGGIGAAGLWGVNRMMAGDDQDLRKLEIERDTYGRLAKEVSEELKRRNLDPTPANTAAVVDYLT